MEVTTQLAGPAAKGGIAVALQQPRHNHPFEKGLDAVIQDSETLCAIDDIFSTVSCASLDIRTNVAVVDIVPYICEDIKKLMIRHWRSHFVYQHKLFVRRSPLSCSAWARYGCQGRASPISGRGMVGSSRALVLEKKFGETPKFPVTVRVRHGKREFVHIRRVNGFHPSYAMNYHPHVSILRQLQILIGAEACGMMRGDWQEEKWMGELRCCCQDERLAEFSGKIKIFVPK